ncbi:response regulator transcription factor [Foetidibacter luteolus]|uniref:response regulator transcription factor n=1 Tax=Foetidibacter luteolus TaxID=2608880 RepID=UPI00129B3BD6|nr:response regulator transcription factor [Foetidibacter luteolus]
MLFCVIDDHKMITQFLKMLLEDTFKGATVKTFLSMAELLAENFEQEQPALIICDILLPNANGLEMILREREHFPGAQVMMLTSLADPAIVRHAIQNGVDGYVCKDASAEEIVEAVKTVLEGKKYVSDTLKNNMMESLLFGDHPIFDFSLREKEVLINLCKGYAPKEIAVLLSISIHTVNQHIKNMLRKLQLNRTTELVVFALKNRLYSIDL